MVSFIDFYFHILADLNFASYILFIYPCDTHSAVGLAYLWLDIPKFDTVLLHSNWSSLRRKYLSKIPTDINVLSCGPKAQKISGISDEIHRKKKDGGCTFYHNALRT